MLKTPSVLDNYPLYEVIIGMEIHVQLTTKTKIFCGCANQIVKEPNSNICVICTGQPGTLPVFNKHVLENAILLGLATHSTITQDGSFARKHYFYPDLPKNYQITQDNTPICTGGYIPIKLEDGTEKKITLTRIHMEEDAGKNIHAGQGESFVDLNRAGTPLLEVVTEPVISSAYETREYLKGLRATVQYLGICTGNMEDGAFRGDTNISVRKKGATKLGTKVELKNINSFKFISDAIEYEIERQIDALERGEKILQETRLWDSKNKRTVVMRSKEEAADYRYFQDPDLPLIQVADQQIEAIRAHLPELPWQKFNRLCTQDGLSEYEAEILIEDINLADYFDKARAFSRSTSLINWILRDVMGYLKEHKITLAEFNVTPEKLAQIIELVENNTINGSAAKEVFAEVALSGAQPNDIVEAKGLKQLGSSDELETIIKEIVAAFPGEVAEYKSGKDRLFGFFVGTAMKKTQGRGNPKVIQELLKKYLN